METSSRLHSYEEDRFRDTYVALREWARAEGAVPLPAGPVIDASEVLRWASGHPVVSALLRRTYHHG